MNAVVRFSKSTRFVLAIVLGLGLARPARGDVPSWIPTDLGGVDVRDIALEPGPAGRIWAATAGGGLLVSIDRGESFTQQVVSGLDPRVNAVDFDPQDPSVLYAATSDGLFRVAGSTAVRLWRGSSNTYPSSLEARWVSVDPGDPRVLLVGTTAGCILRSGDRGTTWTTTRCGGHPYRSSVERALFDSSGSGLALAPYFEWYQGAGLLRSADRGATWSDPEPRPGPAGGGAYLGRITIASGLPGEAYRSQERFESPRPTHLVSRDFGLTWAAIEPANSDAVGPLVLLRSGELLSIGPGGAYRTDRASGRWVRAAVGLPSGVIRRVVALDDAGEDLLLATSTGLYKTARSAEASVRAVLLPTVVDAVGKGGARFASAFTLYNASDGMAEGFVDYVASEAAGATGSGSIPFRLPAREQLVVADALGWLRAAGLAVPEATPRQPQVGTLTLRTSDGLWGGAVVAVARVTTPSGPGLAGTGLWSVPAPALLNATSYLPGLSESAAERTNVAVANAGANGRVTLRATFRHAGGSFTKEATLDPGQWVQWNSPLASEGVGRADATIERISGDEPYWAYATIVDAATNDGSYLPARATPAPGPSFVPAAVEARGFESEVVVFNPGSVAATASLVYFDSLDPASSSVAPSPAYTVMVPAEGSVALPRIVDHLRAAGVPIGPPSVSHAGLLRVEASVDGSPVPVLASARTTIAAPSGGAYGVSYPALAPSDLASSEAWVTGLGPGDELRSSLALLNPAASAVELEWRVFPESPTAWDPGLEGRVSLQPGEWRQLLLETSSGPSHFPIHNSVVRVRKVSGPGPFAAYGIVNDGRSPGLGTGDGTYVPMSLVK